MPCVKNLKMLLHLSSFERHLFYIRILGPISWKRPYMCVVLYSNVWSIRNFNFKGKYKGGQKTQTQFLIGHSFQEEKSLSNNGPGKNPNPISYRWISYRSNIAVVRRCAWIWNFKNVSFCTFLVEKTLKTLGSSSFWTKQKINFSRPKNVFHIWNFFFRVLQNPSKIACFWNWKDTGRIFLNGEKS